MLDSRDARVAPPLVRSSALAVAVFVTVALGVVATAAGPRASGAVAASMHLIDVGNAERVTRATVRVYASGAATVFHESRGFRARLEETVECRRVAGHRASCSWRAFVYVVGPIPRVETLFIVCLGRAGVRVDQGRLRVDLRGAGCAH